MLDLADKKNLMEVYITPMITEGLLSMTEPDNPTSRNQMYVATKAEKP
ncbi:Fic family protein [Bacteroides sp.]